MAILYNLPLLLLPERPRLLMARGGGRRLLPLPLLVALLSG